jgi:Ca2+-transporting ATPase
MAVTTVIMFQIFYMLNCRSLKDSIFKIGLWSNPTVYLGIGSILVLQALFVYFPPLQTVFSTAPLGPIDWLFATLVGAIILPVVSMEKFWHKMKGA